MSSVDVIVPCYRYGHFLRGCVESVLTQTGPDVRVLIIDDASPDNTADIASELAKEDSRVTFLRHAANKGHIATYNEGIGWVSADYMLLLSADDYLLPGALGRSANLMDLHPEVGFTFGKAITLSIRKGTWDAKEFIDNGDQVKWRILDGLQFIKLSGSRCIVKTPTAVVRTQLQKRLGGYRPELPHTGDMEMWLRLAAHASVGVIEAYQAVYREHDRNMSLDYCGQSWLPDLKQRKLALECFFKSCSCKLTNAHQVHRSLFWLLGCDAVSLASAAYSNGEIELSQRLSEFARLVCPQVIKSSLWIRFVFKRNLGCRAWRALQPTVRGIRYLESSVKRMLRRV